jgi:hypothetical protein
MPERDCNTAAGEACRRGAVRGALHRRQRAHSYFGCEYYGVDLDNIVETGGRSAASQQYAIVVSNPDPVLTVRVEVHRNNAPPGQPPSLERIASAVIPPRDLEVFSLPAREVDCSTVAGLNDGTGTCLSSRAYRVTANFPVVAYQFNPLENVGVFSNDASLLVPTNSLQGSYRVLGYPQQWSRTMDPDTNGGDEIRSFMTIVGTRGQHPVRIDADGRHHPRRAHSASGCRGGRPFEMTLGPSTCSTWRPGRFSRTSPGSLVTADRPVAVFTGTECSDVPFWRTSSRAAGRVRPHRGAALPRSNRGQNYVLSRSPTRTRAVLPGRRHAWRRSTSPSGFVCSTPPRGRARDHHAARGHRQPGGPDGHLRPRGGRVS